MNSIEISGHFSQRIGTRLYAAKEMDALLLALLTSLDIADQRMIMDWSGTRRSAI